MELCASVPWKYRDRWNNGCRITKGPRQSCVSLKETWQGVLRGKNWLPVENGTARLGIVEQPTKTDHCDNEEKLVAAEYLVSDLECARIYANTPCNQASWCFAQVRKMKAWKREPYTRDTGRDLTERIQIQSWATTRTTTSMTRRRSHRRHDRRSSSLPSMELWTMLSARCLDVGLWVRAASNWSLIPGIAQSKNRQHTVRRLVDYGHREHCNWSIGPSHPWLPFASTISTVDITTLTTLPRALPSLPYAYRYRLTYPLPLSRTHAAISAYNLGPEFSRATASSSFTLPPSRDVELPTVATPCEQGTF